MQSRWGGRRERVGAGSENKKTKKQKTTNGEAQSKKKKIPSISLPSRRRGPHSDAFPPPKKRNTMSDEPKPPPAEPDPLADLSPTPEAGLSTAEAAARLAQFGRNELVTKQQSKLKLILKLVRWWRGRWPPIFNVARGF